MMNKLLPSIMFSLLSISQAVFAGQFENVRDSLAVIETSAGRKCGIILKMKDGTFILTSQDVFSGGIVSIKSLSGKYLQPLSFESPEQPNGLLRIKTEGVDGAQMQFQEKINYGEPADVFKTSSGLGIISELPVKLNNDNTLAGPYIEELTGSPVISKDGKLIGIAGSKGFIVNKASWLTLGENKNLLDKSNEVQLVNDNLVWRKIDYGQFIKQGMFIGEAEDFLLPFTQTAGTWCKNPYTPIELKSSQAEKMKSWIESNNTSLKGIPVLKANIQDSSKTMGDSMKNITATQLRKEMLSLGKRLQDFCPFYQKTLTSPSTKWETAYLKKKSLDLSNIYKACDEGLRKEIENSVTKINPPL
ncbi:MAG: hypothetical protein WC637_14850 [Victivallales bacterium]|jgi:hypothetical protein